MQELKIRKISNGFILKWKEESETEEGKFNDIERVLEDRNDYEEQIVLKDLLELVAEHFGYEYSKWNTNNLNIGFDKIGDKLLPRLTLQKKQPLAEYRNQCYSVNR